MARKRYNVYVEEEAMARLREMAAALGMLSPTGSQVGLGNVSRLLEAIARGDVVPTGMFFEDMTPQTMADVVDALQKEQQETRAALEEGDARLAALEEELAQFRQEVAQQREGADWAEEE